MGLIEKMISEAVRRETGFNPRRLIRRVGGRNLLLAGGAALAGGLLASQARGQMQSATSAGASSPTIDPAKQVPAGAAAGPAAARAASLPPLPKASTSPPSPPPLPPVPSADEVDAVDSEAADEMTTAGTDTLPVNVRYAITRTMVAAALADGELASDEKALIDEQLASGDLQPAQVEQIRKDLVVPPSALELAAGLPAGEGPELLLQFAILTIRSDGQASPRERTWLHGLGNALGVAVERIEQIENELFPGVASA